MEPFYYITNQYNLREILSGGFIGPRASFDDKYYVDLLAECPGRIPLFTLPIDASLFEKVNAHDPKTSFAVVLQIDPTHIENPASAGIAYADVISLKNVVAIHFLSAENRREFEARSYSNMPAPRELYKVTPELAQTPGHTPDILKKLKALRPLIYPTPDQFSTGDRVSGAISLCIYKSQDKEQNKHLLKLLDPAAKQRRTTDIPAWFYQGFKKKTKKELYKLRDVNELVFGSSITVLHSYSLNTVSQREKILDEIRTLIDAHPAMPEQKETLVKSFVKIARVLQLEDDFEPFRPGPGYDAIRGLLLFLMRPHHRDLLSAGIAELNASQPVLLTALAYSGIVIGRKGLDTEYRPADTEIAEYLVADFHRMAIKDKNHPRPETPYWFFGRLFR